MTEYEKFFTERKLPDTRCITQLRDGDWVYTTGSIDIIKDQKIVDQDQLLEGISSHDGEAWSFCASDIEELHRGPRKDSPMIAQAQEKIDMVTFGDMYEGVKTQMQKNALWTDILDYDKVSRDIAQIEIFDSYFDVEWSVNAGGSEGYYLDLYIVTEKGRANFATIKTLCESDSAYMKMAILGASFYIEAKKWVQENKHLLDREGYRLFFFNEDDGGIVWPQLIAPSGLDLTGLKAWADEKFTKQYNSVKEKYNVSASLFRMGDLIAIAQYPMALEAKSFAEVW
jgi:hypothetical protein